MWCRCINFKGRPSRHSDCRWTACKYEPGQRPARIHQTWQVLPAWAPSQTGMEERSPAHFGWLGSFVSLLLERAAHWSMAAWRLEHDRPTCCRSTLRNCTALPVKDSDNYLVHWGASFRHALRSVLPSAGISNQCLMALSDNKWWMPVCIVAFLVWPGGCFSEWECHQGKVLWVWHWCYLYATAVSVTKAKPR